LQGGQGTALPISHRNFAAYDMDAVIFRLLSNESSPYG